MPERQVLVDQVGQSAAKAATLVLFHVLNWIKMINPTVYAARTK